MQHPAHKRIHQPVSSPSSGTKAPFAKRVVVGPVGASKPVMSRTPPTFSGKMSLVKNPNGTLVNSELILSFQSQVSQQDMHVNEDTQQERSPEPFHVESESRQNHSSEEELPSKNEDLNEGGSIGKSAKKATFLEFDVVLLFQIGLKM